ncbi:putative lipid II flippase FtsW [Paenibacillus selenitireducens]|uniref:Probable peptidoglycan glycosyltransferase FtsW n=1 Tax=Paenibacillus selenitireducens TaxID=1324314 RepID=A0A1T2X6A4_9BACL|nr:putative lipid II flippase FtsW [Paenibacillus selenitireducens]OPA75216.1 putative lipid II flippase FtsW [Paenibacillus selenitireducens]
MSGKIRGRPDFLLLFVTILLVGFGLIMIFSASSPMAMTKHDSPWHYVMKQGVFALIGLFVMLIFMSIPYTYWKKAAPILLLISFCALILVLFAGTNINGARRWFVLSGFNLQPSEFTKLTVIVYMSALVSRKGDQIRDFKRGLLPILLVIGILLLLVLKQPDFGTVLILFFIAATILIIGGVDLRHIFLLSLALIPIFVYLAVSQSYRLQRISSFMNPLDNPQSSGYQLIQSLYALGHGGVTGTGLGQSVQKLFYLPEAHTDFIFAVIGEEFGFVGTLLLIISFFLLIWRGFIAAIRSNEPFGVMLGIGIVMMIFIQFLLNIGAVTGSLPITGVPLPFISYGGSSLILCLASTGILLSISRDNYHRRQEAYRNSTK